LRPAKRNAELRDLALPNMPHSKSRQYHVEIEQNLDSEWGVQVREDVTGGASIHVYGMTRDEAIHELRDAAKALAAAPPEQTDRPSRSGPTRPG
jgi:hypothetical protein